MVRSRELLDLMSTAARVSEGTAEQHYRRLRQKRLVTHGGVGKAAPHMTLRDGAVILLSLAISESPTQGPSLVSEFLALPKILFSIHEDEPRWHELAEDIEKFEDLLVRLLEWSLSWPKGYVLEVHINYNDMEIGVEVKKIREGFAAEYMFAGIFGVEETPSGWGKKTDFQRRTSFGDLALGQIARCIVSG